MQSFLDFIMASFSFHFLLVFLCFSFLFSASECQTTDFNPNKLVIPVHKDVETNLHVTRVHKRTPQTVIQLLVDLNGRFMWVNCDQSYLSSTYQAPRCHSTPCSKAKSDYCLMCTSKPRPGCHNNTCGLLSWNPVTKQAAMGELAQDVLSIQSISKGFKSGPMVRMPQFLFVCAPSRLLQNGLPKYVQGVAGLGHGPISLPTQLASNLGFAPNFALCLTSSTRKTGVIFFGEGPFYMLPGISVPRPVGWAPLIISKQGEYYMDVRSIKINQKIVPLNTSLLTINYKQGVGGTMISTTTPYTVLEHSIYQSFTKFFASQFSEAPLQAKPVAPFGLCYDAKKISSTRIGPGVPKISLVFRNQSVVWTIFGANSMVEARPGVACLAFVDGGLNPRGASIVIGAHQLEDNFLQFDLARSRLGFSSSLLFHRTNCGNFNFNFNFTKTAP